MAIDKNEHLLSVLKTHKMSHIDSLLSKYKVKRDEVRKALEEEYADNIYGLMNSGSYAKHTAMNSKFDLDIIVPFKKDAFETLEKMFENIYEFLYNKYQQSGAGIVRKQKVSIGIEFHPDNEGDVINLDIVPGRELNHGSYSEAKDLNLMFNEQAGLFPKNSRIKTNIQNQIDHIRKTGDERHSARQIIRLFKIWKFNSGEKYKSFLLELLTIKAFNNADVTGDLWEKLKKVMEYIRDNVTTNNFKLTDPGNSNNNVIETLESWERSDLASRMDTIIKRIEEDSENIKYYFPVNEKFEEKARSQNSYGLKGAIITPSIPSNNQRFG
ncbi:hypothetical protein [Pontibacter litorisediminis]|uniref:hypothetical protein n=1 Tax=Pontibacter litorisediminis TaxID=1846260 RepID=UPI0023EDD3AA|nr:hypothetical protein [Pontibacter litorisediminis]